MTDLATRGDLVRHLSDEHGYSPAVAAELSEMGARLAHARSHLANPELPHDHATR